MKLPAVLAGLALVGAAATAHGHAGATIAYASFTSPAEPMVTRGDPLSTVAPFTIMSADTSATITWEDGGTDPTGRFFFYFFDHEPTYGINVDNVDSAMGVKIDDPVNNDTGYFISCTCSADMGVVCPTVVRNPATNCERRRFTWDTSKLKSGTYWVMAVNFDPPYHVYSAALAPIRVAHGSDPLPPAVVFVRPDGFGAYDTSESLQWIASGTPPLTFDLSYAIEDKSPIDTTNVIAQGITPPLNPDGLTYSYNWDLSAVPNNTYYVRVKVTDGNGVSTTADSHFGINVFHNGGGGSDGGGGADMAMAPKPTHHSGCSAAPEGAPDRGVLAAMALVLLGAAVGYGARRRRR